MNELRFKGQPMTLAELEKLKTRVSSLMSLRN